MDSNIVLSYSNQYLSMQRMFLLSRALINSSIDGEICDGRVPLSVPQLCTRQSGKACNTVICQFQQYLIHMLHVMDHSEVLLGECISFM